MKQDNNIPLLFSGHQTFALRQLWPAKAFYFAKKAIKTNKAPLFSGEEAMSDLGVGSKMVESIKYWGNRIGILDSNSQPTLLANTIFGDNYNGLDPFLEKQSTLWLFHWNIASTYNQNTSAWYIFNKFSMINFTKEDLFNDIQTFANKVEDAKNKKQRISQETIKRDIDTILKLYAPSTLLEKKYSKNIVKDTNLEEQNESILKDLNLIKPISINEYVFNRSERLGLNKYLFVYCLLDFWIRYTKESGSNTLTPLNFNDITYNIGSPGRVFKLNEHAIDEYLLDISLITNNTLQWVEQSGLHQLICVESDISKLESLQKELLIKALKNE